MDQEQDQEQAAVEPYVIDLGTVEIEIKIDGTEGVA